MTFNRKRALPIALIAVAGSGAAAASASGPAVTDAGRQVSTDLISRSLGGGIPNGPSTNAVISGDRRYARIIAFESEASNLVRGDSNGQKDVFVVPRSGSINDRGTAWRGSDAVLVSVRGTEAPRTARRSGHRSAATSAMPATASHSSRGPATSFPETPTAASTRSW